MHARRITGGHSAKQRARTVGIRWVRLIDRDIIVGGGVLLVLCPAAADSPMPNELAIESPDGVLRRLSCPGSSKQDVESQNKQVILHNMSQLISGATLNLLIQVTSQLKEFVAGSSGK